MLNTFIDNTQLYSNIRFGFSQDQVRSLTSEYEDAVQRARRLSLSRETILIGRGNPAPLVSQDDLLIYLRWLVCHLHSVHPVHSFLRVNTHTLTVLKSSTLFVFLFIITACGFVCFLRCCTMYQPVKGKKKDFRQASRRRRKLSIRLKMLRVRVKPAVAWKSTGQFNEKKESPPPPPREENKRSATVMRLEKMRKSSTSNRESFLLWTVNISTKFNSNLSIRFSFFLNIGLFSVEDQNIQIYWKKINNNPST